MEYGEKWKRHRKYLQTHLQKGRLQDYYDIQTNEVHHMLKDFLNDPKAYRAHIRRYVCGIVIQQLTYRIHAI